MAEILVHLQNLTGETLEEFFLSLNILIRQQSNAIKSNLNYILTNFEADNHLKQLTKIRLIDQYQCYDEMLNTLKSDDSFYISHVLQCNWFFKNTSFDPNELVNSVFPMLSFSTRTKLLKKYSKFLNNSSVADSLFIATKNRYGLNAAIPLLPSCSEYFIKQLLENICIQLPIYVLIPIYKAYPSVIVNYLKHLLESKEKKKRVVREFRLDCYEKLLRIIASKEPDVFSSLVEKHRSSLPFIRLGKRSSRRLLNSSYESVKNNTKAYQGVIIWKHVTTNLNLDQISNIQLVMFPKSPSDFIKNFSEYSDFMSLISHIKNKKVKQNLLANNFHRAFKKPITDFIDSLNFNLVRQLPPEVTEKWVELKLPGVEDHYTRGDYTVYLPVDRAIPQLKKMLESQSDPSTRIHFMKCLFQILALNDDPKLVGPMCEYVVKRFRNDRTSLKEHVVSSLVEYKKLMEIPEEAWTPIEELINIMIITGYADAYSSDFITLISKRIQYRLQRGLPVQDYLEKLVKCRLTYYGYDLCANTPYEKQCLEWFIEWFPEKSGAKFTMDNDLEAIFSRLLTWNSKHPNEQIPLPDWMIQHLDNIFNDENNYAYRKNNLLGTMRKKDKSLLFKFYSKIYLKYIDSQILVYKLRSEPLTVKNNLDFILNKLLAQRLDSYIQFFKQIRLYSFLGIPELLSELCMKALHEKKDEYSTYQNKRNAIMILSLMLPSNKYKELISNYYPKGSTIEDFSDEGRELLEIQTEIALSFKNISNPSNFLEPLSKFTIGDYLKLVVGSLNSTFLRTAEYKILPVLHEGLDKPVSVKKHFIRGIFKVAPIQSTLEMLLELFEKEKNVSIRLILFENSLRFFLNEPCSETFSVLKAVIEQLEPADEDAFDKLFNIEKVPDEFLSIYFHLLWDKVTIKRDEVITFNRNKIIKLIEPSMFPYFTEEFFDPLIRHVFNQPAESLSEMQIFVVNYLLFSNDKEQQNRRLEKIISGMTKLFDQWNHFNIESEFVFLSRNTLSLFIDNLVRISISNKQSERNGGVMSLSPFDLLETFRLNLLKKLKEEEVLEENILLLMSGFFSQAESHDPKAMIPFAKFIESIVDKVIPIYSIAFISNISSIIKKIMNWRYSQSVSDENLLTLSEIFIMNDLPHYKMIGINLLNSSIYKNRARYEKLIRFIMHISEPVLKPSINFFLKSLNSSFKEEDSCENSQ